MLLFGKIESDVMSACESYLVITTFSLPALAIYDAGAALCRSIEKTNATMYISAVTNVLNIIGNCVGVLVFHLGAAGVAYPSLITRILSACAVTMYCFNSKLSVSYLIFGIYYETCHGSSLYNGNRTMHGARDIDSANYYFKKLNRITLVLSILWNTFVFVITPLIIHYSAISDRTKSLVIWLVLINNIFNALAYPFAGLLGNGLRAAGDVKFTSFISISACSFNVLFQWCPTGGGGCHKMKTKEESQLLPGNYVINLCVLFFLLFFRYNNAISSYNQRKI